MSQPHLNRLWTFESSYETDAVLYAPNAKRADQTPILAASVVVPEVARVDRLGQQHHAAGRCVPD